MKNKLERKVKKHFKFISRLKKYGLLSKIDDPTYNLHALKSHGAPCSCHMCSGMKYKRNIKHKKRNETD